MENLDQDLPPNSNEGNEAKEGENDKDSEKGDDYVKRLKEQLHGRESQAKEKEEEALLNKTALKVLKDQTILADMDRKKAEQVVKLLFENGHATTDDLDEILESLEPTTSKKKVKSEDELLEELEKRLESKKAQEFVVGYVDKLPSSLRWKIKDEFEELRDWRKLTTEQSKKYLDRIVAYYRKDSDNDEKFLKAASAWIETKDTTKPKKSTLATAQTLGFSKAEMKALWLL